MTQILQRVSYNMDRVLHGPGRKHFLAPKAR